MRVPFLLLPVIFTTRQITRTRVTDRTAEQLGSLLVNVLIISYTQMYFQSHSHLEIRDSKDPQYPMIVGKVD